MIEADPRSQMLFEMGQCAYRLGIAFGGEAERAETHEGRVEFFQLFERCAFAARMSVALELRLRRPARAEMQAGARAGAYVPEREPAERDPIERDASETETEGDAETYLDAEADRERDREPVSLPVLLRSLTGIVADASALPGPPPAALPTLRELLTRLNVEPVKAGAAPAMPSRGGGPALKARLAGSVMTLARPLPSGRSLRPERTGGLAVRRATGPPR